MRRLFGLAAFFTAASVLLVGVLAWSGGDGLQLGPISGAAIAVYTILIWGFHLILAAGSWLGLGAGEATGWLSAQRARKALMWFLAVCSLLVTGPWSGTMAFVWTDQSWVLGIAAFVLVVGFAWSWGRERLLGKRFLSVLTFVAIGGMLPFVVSEAVASGPANGIWTTLGFLAGGWLWAGLAIQYPAMLRFAWRTPVKAWDGSGDGDEPKMTFEAVAG